MLGFSLSWAATAAAAEWSLAGSLNTARAGHTATLLGSGKVLVTGGSQAGAPNVLAGTELYDPAANAWSTAGSMGSARAGHTATALLDGRVLVAGGGGGGGTVRASVEIHDPAANLWTGAPSMNAARAGHTATLLANGKVLITGGYSADDNGGSNWASAELYDPATNTWTSAGSMGEPRSDHAATALLSGKVLVSGGWNRSGWLDSAELYDPAVNSWTSVGRMSAVRAFHSATRLATGKVLTVGSGDGNTRLSAELYDPSTNAWAPAGESSAARAHHTATPLPDGRVLVAGGGGGSGVVSGAEFYDGQTNAWTNAGSMSAPRNDHTATLLTNGKVLVAGGYRSGNVAVAELFDPAPGHNFGGLWWNPNESGWGINFAHQGDTIFATWFTYDAQGKPRWLIALLSRTASGVYAGPVSTVSGPPFNAVPFAPAPVETVVGTMTVTFADAGHATLAYVVNGAAQTKAIVPQAFGVLPTCVWGAQPDLALATNYQDLWWNPSESGWGVAFTHQGDTIFATWFTYDAQGKPWWLIAVLPKTAANVYSGSVSTVTGPPFTAVPWTHVTETEIGTATATFADGNRATFAYTVSGTTRTKSITRQVFAPPGTVCQGAPAAPSSPATLIEPGAAVSASPPQLGNRTPTYRWSAVAGATAYTLRVARITGVTEANLLTATSTAAQAGCGSGSNSCSATPATVLTIGDTIQWTIVAANGDGDGPSSAALRFVVGGSPTSSAPAAASSAASAISGTGATLRGVVSSHGMSTTVTFQYGLTTSYGSSVEAAQNPLPPGASDTAVSSAIAGLACDTTYHFRVVGTNLAGTAYGADATFATAACTVGMKLSTNAAVPFELVTVDLTQDSANLTLEFVTAQGGVIAVEARRITARRYDVGVPPLVDPKTLATAAGVVQVRASTIVNGSPLVLATLGGFSIAAPLELASVRPGAIVKVFVDEQARRLSALQQELQILAQTNPSLPGLASLPAAAAYTKPLMRLVAIGTGLAAREDGADVAYATSVGLPQKLTEVELHLLDKLLYAALVTAPARQPASAGIPSKAALDSVEEFRQAFAVDLPAQIRDMAPRVRTAAMVVVGVAAFAIGGEAVVVAAGLGAMAFAVTTIVPAAVTMVLEGGINSLSGKDVTAADFESTIGIGTLGLFERARSFVDRIAPKDDTALDMAKLVDSIAGAVYGNAATDTPPIAASIAGHFDAVTSAIRGYYAAQQADDSKKYLIVRKPAPGWAEYLQTTEFSYACVTKSENWLDQTPQVSRGNGRWFFGEWGVMEYLPQLFFEDGEYTVPTPIGYTCTIDDSAFPKITASVYGSNILATSVGIAPQCGRCLESYTSGTVKNGEECTRAYEDLTASFSLTRESFSDIWIFDLQTAGFTVETFRQWVTYPGQNKKEYTETSVFDGTRQNKPFTTIGPSAEVKYEVKDLDEAKFLASYYLSCTEFKWNR